MDRDTLEREATTMLGVEVKKQSVYDATQIKSWRVWNIYNVTFPDFRMPGGWSFIGSIDFQAEFEKMILSRRRSKVETEKLGNKNGAAEDQVSSSKAEFKAELESPGMIYLNDSLDSSLRTSLRKPKALLEGLRVVDRLQEAAESIKEALEVYSSVKVSPEALETKFNNDMFIVRWGEVWNHSDISYPSEDEIKRAFQDWMRDYGQPHVDLQDIPAEPCIEGSQS